MQAYRGKAERPTQISLGTVAQGYPTACCVILLTAFLNKDKTFSACSIIFPQIHILLRKLEDIRFALQKSFYDYFLKWAIHTLTLT